MSEEEERTVIQQEKRYCDFETQIETRKIRGNEKSELFLFYSKQEGRWAMVNNDKRSQKKGREDCNSEKLTPHI